MKALVRILAGCLAVIAMISCTGNAPGPMAGASNATAPPTDYRQLATQAGRVYALDPGVSRIRIYAFRGGRVASAGHNHVLTANVFTGFAYLPAAKLADARFDLSFPLDKLVVDDPAMRKDAGPAFATELDAAAIKGTREHMLGLDNLDAAHFPDVSIHCVSVAGELPHAVATVAVTLHGQMRQQLVPLVVTLDAARLRINGAFALRQSDFGITPYSIMGGLLTVQDEVAIEFELIGVPASFDAPR